LSKKKIVLLTEAAILHGWLRRVATP